MDKTILATLVNEQVLHPDETEAWFDVGAAFLHVFQNQEAGYWCAIAYPVGTTDTGRVADTSRRLASAVRVQPRFCQKTSTY